MKLFDSTLLFACCVFLSCEPSIDEGSSIELYRFDKDLVDNEINKDLLDSWYATDSAFTQSYLYRVISSPPGKEVESLQAFRDYLDETKAIEGVEKNFKNLGKEITQFQEAKNELYKHYPDYPNLDLASFYSGFTLKGFLLDNKSAIALDMYLGEDFDYTVFGEAIPLYQIETLKREYIIPDILENIYYDIYPDKAELNTLLERMLYNGKLAFFKRKLQPKIKEHTALGMTKDSYDWCVRNEVQIWTYFIETEMLYSNQYQDFKTYINLGPHSAGMPEDAPANTGSFIGYRIIQALAKKENSFTAIMENENAQNMLTDSKYRP